DKTCKVAAPGVEDRVVSANGSFSFLTPLNIGDNFSVDVAPGGQPASPNQTCSVTIQTAGKAAVGQVFDANITLQVACTTERYTVGGSVSGLAAGNSVELQINGGETVSVNGNQPFVFPTALDDGSPFTVGVSAQPTSPNQTCGVSRQVIDKGDGALDGQIDGFNVS